MARAEMEAALTAWREAERRLEVATDGRRPELAAEVERTRVHFQELSGAHMVERLDALRAAEHRRQLATPSTPPFHQAARDEADIAREIWSDARTIDREAP